MMFMQYFCNPWVGKGPLAYYFCYYDCYYYYYFILFHVTCFLILHITCNIIIIFLLLISTLRSCVRYL